MTVLHSTATRVGTQVPTQAPLVAPMLTESPPYFLESRFITSCPIKMTVQNPLPFPTSTDVMFMEETPCVT